MIVSDHLSLWEVAHRWHGVDPNKAANEWEWLDKAPFFRLLPEPTRRIRWLKHDEATCLLAELPEHLQAMVRFSLETGLKESQRGRIAVVTS